MDVDGFGVCCLGSAMRDCGFAEIFGLHVSGIPYKESGGSVRRKEGIRIFVTILRTYPWKMIAILMVDWPSIDGDHFGRLSPRKIPI